MRAIVFSFSLRGAILSKKIGEFLSTLSYKVDIETLPKYSKEANLPAMTGNHYQATKRAFENYSIIVFVGSVGIAVRSIAPFLKNKLVDPAIVSVDERGNFVIPLIAGHIGGSNEIARVIATHLEAEACITTATDVNGLFAVDEWAARNKMIICSLNAAKDFAAALVHNDTVGFFSDFPLDTPLPRQIKQSNNFDQYSIGMAVTLDKTAKPFQTTVLLLPKIVHLGIGCRKNTPVENIEALVFSELERLNIDTRCIVGIASIDLKKDEQGLISFAEKYTLPIKFYSAEELNSVKGNFTSSILVEKTVGVDNVCERSAVLSSNNGDLILQKTSLNGVTVSIATEKITLDLNKKGLRTK